MGIQINGNTNNINAGIGSLSIEDLNELHIVGVATAANFKTGTSNLHSTGLNIFDLDVDGHTNLDNVSIAGVTTFTGNIGGTATFQDIDVDGHTNLDNVSVSGVSTFSNDVNFTTANGNNLLLDNSDNSLKFGDNVKAKFGTGTGDLEIYHTGTGSVINDIGVGYLHLRTAGSNRINIQPDNVQLCHSGNSKLETTSTGINVTGAITASGTIETTGSELKITGAEPRLTFTDTDNNPDFQLWANAQRFSIYDSTNSATRIRIDSSGNIGMNTTTTSDSTGNCRAYTFARTDVNGQVRIILKNQGTGFGNGAGYHQGIDGSNVFLENRSNGGAIDIATISSNTYASRLRISAEGYVNKPYHPAFCATRIGGSHIQLASSSNTDVDFPTKDFDNSNSFNGSNGRFTAPIAGKYYFGVQFYCGFSVTSIRVMHAVWKKNGSNSHEADLFGGIGNFGNSSMNHYHPTTNAHVMLELAAGDYVTFNTGSNSFIGGGNTYLYASKGSRFFGYLVA